MEMNLSKNDYPDSPVENSRKSGDEFQDFVAYHLNQQRGIQIDYHKTKWQQYNIGESKQGYEIKLDSRCTETSRLSIEIAEKTKISNTDWIPSGIYREDNTIFYVQGNYKVFFIFTIPCLRRLHGKYINTVIEKYGTVRTFYLPIKEAYNEAEYFIQIKPRPAPPLQVRSALFQSTLAWLDRVVGENICFACGNSDWWIRPSDSAKVCNVCHPNPDT